MNKKSKVLIDGIDLDMLYEIIEAGVKKGIEQALSDSKFGTEYKDEILTRRQVAELMGKSADKISSMFERGELRGYKSGKEYLFLKSHIVSLFNYKK